MHIINLFEEFEVCGKNEIEHLLPGEDDITKDFPYEPPFYKVLVHQVMNDKKIGDAILTSEYDSIFDAIYAGCCSRISKESTMEIREYYPQELNIISFDEQDTGQLVTTTDLIDEVIMKEVDMEHAMCDGDEPLDKRIKYQEKWEHYHNLRKQLEQI